MLFHSYTYLLFLFLVVLLYRILSRRNRLWMLFLSSATFYGFWRAEFLPLLMGSVYLNYFAAIRISEAKSRAKRKWWLWSTMGINLGLLGFFKYTYFFLDSIHPLFTALGLNDISLDFKIILPLGISFYTFQSISYVVDVYRANIVPQREFLLLANYVIFFPQLVAGPILRAKEVLSQLDKRAPFSLDDVGEGLRRILSGLFLKVCLADRISGMVTQGFSAEISELGAFDVWTMAFLFGLQIYFDFSAYSHIAIGSARLLGIRFPENFNYPYSASSPKAFWKRWHISLSSWIRDYLYLPLCKAKVRDASLGGLDVVASNAKIPTSRANIALFTTWALMGLWHGSNWTFVCWGIWHATLVFFYRLIRYTPVPHGVTGKILGWIITQPLIMLGWIFFRADTVDRAWVMISTVMQPTRYVNWEAVGPYNKLQFSFDLDVYLTTLLLYMAVLASHLVKRFAIPYLRSATPVLLLPLETTTLAFMTASIFIFMGKYLNVFVYFQF